MVIRNDARSYKKIAAIYREHNPTKLASIPQLMEACVECPLVSTRIVGRRTAPFSTFALFRTACRMVSPKLLVLTSASNGVPDHTHEASHACRIRLNASEGVMPQQT